MTCGKSPLVLPQRRDEGWGDTPETRQCPPSVCRAAITCSGVASHDLGSAGWGERGSLSRAEKRSMKTLFLQQGRAPNRVLSFLRVLDEMTMICEKSPPPQAGQGGAVTIASLSCAGHVLSRVVP